MPFTKARVLVITEGHVEMAAPFSSEMRNAIMHSAEAEGKSCIVFTDKPLFAFVDPPKETIAVLVRLDGFNFDKLVEIPPSAPADILKKGSRVLCQTSEGRKKGTISSAQVRITPSMQHVLTTLTGAIFPLKPIVASIHTSYFSPYHD